LVRFPVAKLRSDNGEPHLWHGIFGDLAFHPSDEPPNTPPPHPFHILFVQPPRADS
jgi:hypothetical protein